MAEEIVFEDPPTTSTGRGSGGTVAELLAPLRSQPGQWARVKGPIIPRSAASWAYAVKRGRVVGIADGEFQTTVRTIDGEGYVWARYVGNGDQ